jgi:autotransporter-associated beta strand protein
MKLRRNLFLTSLIAVAMTHVASAGTTWDGEGANTNIDTQNNWNDNLNPTLTGGTSTLTFGTGGSTATINTNVSVAGIVLNRDANFEIANGAGSLTIGSGGIGMTLPNTTGRTHTISESSLILGASQSWTVTNNTGTAQLNVSSVIDDGASSFGITKAGTGLLVLSNANTFNGAVTISAGTLRVTNSTALGSGTKNIDMQGSSRVFQLSGGVTLANNYTLRMSSNSFDGGGISSIDGTNEIQGAIDIRTGNPALNISSSGTSTLTISGNITNVTDSRPLLFGGNSANDNTVSGVIGENSVDKLMPVTKQGTGTWIFSNSNTYDGGTNINNGTLEIRNANALGTSGTIAFGGGTLKYGTGITTDLSGRFSTAASQAYKINTNGNDVTVGTALNSTDGSLTKEGTGTLTLTTGGSYNGATSVNGGTLVVNGNISTSAVTVASGATLSGIGTVGSTTVNGTFAPGNSIGTLEITGTLSLNNIANFEINPTNGIGFNRSSDLANVSGAINYDGTLNVLYGGLASDFTHGMVFNLFDGSGYFGSFDTLNLPSLTGDLSWQNNLLTDGTLVVIPEPSAALLGGLGLLALLRRRR